MLELRLTFALVAMLVVPGWAILSLAQSWKRFAPLARWCLAISISIAFFPVLFYATRALLPSFQWGPNKIILLLIVGAAMTGWRLRRDWREQFAFDRLEWIALAIFGMTLFTRFWIIRDQPYPAWTDSLHHTLLTLLTANAGRLPFDMQPYFPIPLGQYHLGLYALSGTLEMLTNAPAHTALLWTAQALNGLCGLSVYLVLDRMVGRVGAIVGAATVGLFSFQPAWYVNWGRFTQVASQTIVLTAWLMTWDALRAWKLDWVEHRVEILWSSLVAAGLTAAVFLLHFRVAGFYVPLLTITVAVELFRARAEHRVARVLLGTLAVGIASLVLVSPALWEALKIYIASTTKIGVMSNEVMEQFSGFLVFPWASVFAIGAEGWLVALAVLTGLIGLWKRNLVSVVCAVWVVLLLAMGYLYIFRWMPLVFTNLGAVFIALYLPMGLMIGAGVEESLESFCEPARERAVSIVLGFTLACGFTTGYARSNGVEPFRYFVTTADLAAMDWINRNTPPDAQFAVNTTFWLPNLPHGTDAGYWIPYFAARQTNVGVMISGLAGAEETDRIVVRSREVKKLNENASAIAELQSLGINYIYIGEKGNFAEPGLAAARLSQNASVAYQRDGVTILRLSK